MEFNAASASYKERKNLTINILTNMDTLSEGQSRTPFLLAGDPGTGKCLTGENKIELFINDENLLMELRAFLANGKP